MANKKEELPKTTFAMIDGVHNVNFDPHPFTIGPRHIAKANEGFGTGILNEDVMRSIGCAHPGCMTDYNGHTSDRVAFVKLTAQCTEQQVSDWLKSIIETDWFKSEKIDGFAFIETGIRPTKGITNED